MVEAFQGELETLIERYLRETSITFDDLTKALRSAADNLPCDDGGETSSSRMP